MPQLAWDETDFLSCLEVLPVVEEYGVSHRYVVKKHGLRLELTVFQYAGDVYFTIFRDGVERPIVDIRFSNCSGTMYHKDELGEYLEFAPSVFGDGFQRDFVIPVGLRLRVKPSISLEFFCK